MWGSVLGLWGLNGFHVWRGLKSVGRTDKDLGLWGLNVLHVRRGLVSVGRGVQDLVSGV